MSFRTLLSQRRTRAVLFGAAVVGLVFVGLARLGTFMAREDPLTQADAIFVFAGTFVERPLEAVDLYQGSYAPRVLLTRSMAEREAYNEARKRGANPPGEFNAARSMLVELGVPAGAILTPDRVHDNTGEEAQTLRAVALREGWSRVIVVTSKYHLRRARLACRRALTGTSVQVIMRGTRYDRSEPDRWWRHRADIRWLASEVPKLVVYATGLGT